jgi:predicted component of type VI protein secretion system
MYKMMVTPVVLSRYETWAMTEKDMKRLSTWVRKILRVMYASIVEQGI